MNGNPEFPTQDKSYFPERKVNRVGVSSQEAFLLCFISLSIMFKFFKKKKKKAKANMRSVKI